jgi:hypothetical protein
VEPSPLLPWLFIGLLFQSWMIGGGDCKALSGMNNWQCLEETCHSATVNHRSHKT